MIFHVDGDFGNLGDFSTFEGPAQSNKSPMRLHRETLFVPLGAWLGRRAAATSNTISTPYSVRSLATSCLPEPRRWFLFLGSFSLLPITSFHPSGQRRVWLQLPGFRQGLPRGASSSFGAVSFRSFHGLTELGSRPVLDGS